MNTIRKFALLLGLGISAIAVAGEGSALDTRTDLKLTEPEAVEFLAEMRNMLASIQGIVMGIGTDDRELIVRSARQSGNRMARNTPESVRKKLPQSFKALGGPTHLMFEELAIRAETDDMEALAEFTGELLTQCLSCHSQFKVN
ncbi:MAG: hypothetical protein KDI88_12930 [Gammaproteobacteria bacterium]|nr:hypothetical protein [Gammaproteobacteria bacterium]